MKDDTEEKVFWGINNLGGCCLSVSRLTPGVASVWRTNNYCYLAILFYFIKGYGSGYGRISNPFFERVTEVSSFLLKLKPTIKCWNIDTSSLSVFPTTLSTAGHCVWSLGWGDRQNSKPSQFFPLNSTRKQSIGIYMHHRDEMHLYNLYFKCFNCAQSGFTYIWIISFSIMR